MPSRAALASAIALASLAAPAALRAQTPAGPAATPVTVGALAGPLVAGVCLLSREDLAARSKVGASVTAQLQQLAQDADTSLQAEKARLEARGKALSEKRVTMAAAQFQADVQSLQHHAQALQTEAAERSRQIDATRAQAYGKLMAEAQPFLAQAYGAHHCGLLLTREAALGGNLGNDLTGEVIAALDAKGAPITVELAPETPAAN